ncbi:zf-HC2 domain-containing protein [Dyella telluris]|uniref:Zf-HC2 domain-containing protein n=1 Tax=Dyella telluris TaxID=2763498 RepID=A0A7G8Q3C2_9GAMM|nr:zf-HC2 domain-containing protein [Dyella telluris]QNK01280.1 zf-HC2 domain-containing protein [Dyella telluris]
MKLTKDTDKDCAKAWEAMPWVLQDTAPEEQSLWLTEHLACCEACREEFAQQSRLRLALALPTAIQLNPDAGLKRLLSRLDTIEAETPAAPVRAGSWVTRALVAAVLAQAVGIGILGMELWSEHGERASYRTLSDPAPAAALTGAIRVVPDASMKLADWNALLHSLQLDVVNGPNDVGAYTVVPTHGSTTGDALRQLRATHGIRLAEQVAPGS